MIDHKYTYTYDENFNPIIEKSDVVPANEVRIVSNDIYKCSDTQDLYFVTYKYQIGKPELVSELDYKKPIDLMNRHGDICLYAFEPDSQNRTHLHSIFKSKKNLFRKMFNMKGFTCCIKNIYDYTELEKYILKCQQ